MAERLLHNKRVVVFDWDGTLVDSVPHITDSLAYAASAVGLPELSRKELQNVIGLGMSEALQALYPGMSNETTELFREYYAECFFKKPTVQSDFFPGAIDLIVLLRERGFKIAVATGKSRRGMDKALITTGTHHLFDLTRCADESLSKPNPKMLYEVLDHFSCSASEAVMFGDTMYDLEMANAAGVESIGVAFGVHDEEILAHYQPKAIVRDYQSIIAQVHELEV